MSTVTPLPLPNYFNPHQVGEIWRVLYEERARQAEAWAAEHNIQPAGTDQLTISLLAIDVQNTFCIPGFELFVGGRSGMGAVEDTVRLCEFIYRNLGIITQIIPTLDTHTATQIFHSVFWVNPSGEHPPAMTMISLDDVEKGRWKANSALSSSLAIAPDQLQNYALHYVRTLSQHGKYLLTIWPYHSMLGGIGHALVPAFEEACFFHNLARSSQTRIEIKGGNPLTENYSVLKPEVFVDQRERAIAQKNIPLIKALLSFDVVLIAGQAKSHCVAWTIADLLAEIQAIDPALAKKVYLLEDCTSPVVVPGVVDFTNQADEIFQQFAEAGMNIVKSADPIEQWLRHPALTGSRR